MDLSASEEMVLVGSAQHCTTMAPNESPVGVGHKKIRSYKEIDPGNANIRLVAVGH